MKSLLPLGLAAAGLLTGCGSPQQRAVDALRHTGYHYHVEDFLRAAEEGDLIAIRRFLKAGMPVNEAGSQGDTALIAAAAAGHYPIVAELIAKKANVHPMGRFGRTAILQASEKGHADVVQLLLVFGADLTKTDEKGWTPLTAAAYAGQTAVVSLLAPECSNQTSEALLVAALGGEPTVIEALVRAGALVEHRNAAGQTPLMLAAQAGKLEAVRALILLGADRSAVDIHGKTAAELATLKGFTAVSDLIEQMPTAQTFDPEPVEVAKTESPYLGATASVESSLFSGVILVPATRRPNPVQALTANSAAVLFPD